MSNVIKEEIVAQAWITAGITTEEAKAELITNQNYVLISGKVTKVYGAKVLAIMHSLEDLPAMTETKFSIA